MYKFVYYVFRNLIYYRIPRDVDRSRFGKFLSKQNIAEAHDALTDLFLATVGLKTVANDIDTIPWYIPLSRLQKCWIKKVSKYGYKVGLLVSFT